MAVESTLSLLTAIEQENHATIRLAIDNGAQLDLYLEEKPVPIRTPLRVASRRGDPQSIRLLLDARAEVLAGFKDDRWTALHSAASEGHDAALQLLVSDGEVHENQVMDGFRIMHMVAEVANNKLAEGGATFAAFVAKLQKPEINALSRRLGFENWTPLHVACLRGKMKVAAHLLRCGADKRARTGAVFIPSRKFNEYAAGDAVKPGVVDNFTKVDDGELDSGLLPVHCAALGGHLRTVHVLLKGSDDLFATTHWHEWTPLHCAVWSGNCTLVAELLRIGSRSVINKLDRRKDAKWSPLAIAVARADMQMLRLLLEHGADPLQRIILGDFPGEGFLVHSRKAVHVMAEETEVNKWSSKDERVSLIHLAVVRGDLDTLKLLIQASRTAHFAPTNSKLDVTNVTAPLSETTKALNAGAKSARKRIERAPKTEKEDCDPLSFTTMMGWSPGPLAMLLAVVDLDRHVPVKLVEQIPAPVTNNRLDIFTEILRSGRAFGEDAGTPPVMPERFSDVSETLVMQTCAAFARICIAEGTKETMYRCTHMTLSAATRADRYRTARFLLEEKLAIAQCPFILPIASRPLHAACSLGYGRMSQLLIDHKADPSEADEDGKKPIEKLGTALQNKAATVGAPGPTMKLRKNHYTEILR
jgi:ankyrin repeat protein